MLGPWASAHRGKWGQLTHLEKWIKKIKSENMQKRAVFCVYVIFVVWLAHSVATRRQRGRARARRRTARDSTRCCDAANSSVTVAMTCLSSPTCSTLPTMTFYIASKPTPITFSSLTFLTRLTFRISSVIALSTLH